MKLVAALIALMSLIFFTVNVAYAEDEQCPSITQLRDIYATYADPLPADGNMPYPVDIADPYFEANIQMPKPIFVSAQNLWFVVTRAFVSRRGDPTPFVAFVVFQGTSTQTKTALIAEAKSIIDTQASETSTAVDYPHFLIGEDPNDPTKKYYFDVCMYLGAFDVPEGTRDTDQQDWSAFPIVMADLSPGVSASTLNKAQMRLVREVRQFKAQQLQQEKKHHV